MILVDYTCQRCGRIQERWAASPAPAATDCPSCGGESRRRWSPIGLSGRARPSEQSATSSTPGRSLCSQYPQIPALCHMSESAGRVWVAKYNRDNRSLESELARQESRAKVNAPTMADAVTHHHHSSAPAQTS